ncbi:exodeoxyribonuclease VII large subunit [Coprococcus sp. AF21-14LB]|uniref:exodeoxyribonuclease VII large subunit n=1 Tax=Coprococcus sp. AF21-14LB TaxID=2292231 RepID=UPI000E50BF39|nr:exodeoxyribonuclease VII large subunit [Coprococcus sp. AF21-14LB]RGS82898.1 exodeoxyribonuclease VII large subunit [Coprococcus sp. AF21-14LB]
MQHVYTVKQVNAYIKNMFTQDFMLNRIAVKGEVSNCKYHSSGHIYFSLKDASGVIACVMFAGNRGGLAFRMTEGQQVIVMGSVSTYERDGRYQLYAREIRLDGEGVLYERFQALRQELDEMGMFAAEYKQPIPKYVRKVGIVTAPTGAAVRDIMNIASRRNPYVQLILYPALVQGEGAAKSIVRGIQALDAYGVDVIIAGRGGGSIEDLWAFNEECVARAIFDCHTPVISAVGHETDITIADFVADLRAPTPSAAAELAVYEYGQTKTAMEEIRFTMRKCLMEQIQKARHESERYLLKLHLSHPGNQLRTKKQQLTETEDRIRYLMEHKITEERNRILLCTEQMRRLSPLERLSGGYAFVSKSDGKPVRKISDVQEKDRMQIYLKDGMIEAEVISVKEEGYDR